MLHILTIRAATKVVIYAENNLSSDEERTGNSKGYHNRGKSTADVGNDSNEESLDGSDYGNDDDGDDESGDSDENDVNSDSGDLYSGDESVEVVSRKTSKAAVTNRNTKKAPRSRQDSLSTSISASTLSNRIQKERSQLAANPTGLTRTVPIGPSGGETTYQFIKRILIRYKELYGNMLVPHTFVVLWTSDWPEDMWDVKLGLRVYNIRTGQDHKEHKKELLELGFQYEKVKLSLEWETLKLAFLTYKELNNGSMEMSQKFVVPSDSDWPVSTWGVKLGGVVNNIRSQNQYKLHRSELEEMGFRYNR